MTETCKNLTASSIAQLDATDVSIIFIPCFSQWAWLVIVTLKRATSLCRKCLIFLLSAISIQEGLWSRASAATGSSVPPIWPLEGHFMVDGLCSRNHCRCNCKLIKNHICCTTKTTTMYIATRWRHDLQWSKSTTVDALIQDAAAVPQRWWSVCRRNAYTIPPMSAIGTFARWGFRFSNVLFMIKMIIIIIVVISSIPTDDIQWEAALAGAGHHRSGGTCL